MYTISKYEINDINEKYYNSLINSHVEDCLKYCFELLYSNLHKSITDILYKIYFEFLYKFDYNIINVIYIIEKFNNTSEINIDNNFRCIIKYLTYLHFYICLIINC